MNLFADNVILTVTNPNISLPNLLVLLTQFGKISGLQVNPEKSKALNISLPLPLLQNLQQTFQYQWEPYKLPYLGVFLTRDYFSLYEANYPPIIQKLHTLLDTLPIHLLSWLGHIATIKMTYLPKLLYLVRGLAISILNQVLRQIQTCVMCFIWGNRKPCTSAQVMY